MLPRSKIQGYICYDPRVPVCYFSTHTCRNRVLIEYFNVVSWFATSLPPHSVSSRTRYPWELVQLPTVPSPDLLHIMAQVPSTSPSLSGAPTVGNTIGAVVVGWGISCLYVLASHDRAAYSPSFHIRDSIFGMLCIQVWTYYQRYPNDNWSYKVLVRPCCLCFNIRGRPLTPFVLFFITLVLALVNARRLGLRALVRPFRPVSTAT